MFTQIQITPTSPENQAICTKELILAGFNVQTQSGKIVIATNNIETYYFVCSLLEKYEKVEVSANGFAQLKIA